MADDSNQRTQAERRAATRAHLLDAGRALFVGKGFAETGTPEIVRKAGVTRGALYHHFADKSDLFYAVAKQESEAVGAAIAKATEGITDPMDALCVGTGAYFDALEEFGRAKLLLIEAPAVLGPEKAAVLIRGEDAAELKAGLRAAIASETEVELDALTDILSAAFDRAGLAIASGKDRGPYERTVMYLLDGLKSLSDH